MSDLFISYASQDREKAAALVEELKKRKWSVWWDRKISSLPFDIVIEQELKEAKCVIVLWSRSSISSQWVKIESAEAVKKGVLVSVLIEEVMPPLEFRRYQYVNLTDWPEPASHKEFKTLVESIGTTLSLKGRPKEFTICETLLRIVRYVREAAQKLDKLYQECLELLEHVTEKGMSPADLRRVQDKAEQFEQQQLPDIASTFSTKGLTNRQLVIATSLLNHIRELEAQLTKAIGRLTLVREEQDQLSKAPADLHKLTIEFYKTAKKCLKQILNELYRCSPCLHDQALQDLRATIGHLRIHEGENDQAHWDLYQKFRHASFADSKKEAFVYMEIWRKVEEACDICSMIAPIYYIFLEELCSAWVSLPNAPPDVEVIQQRDVPPSFKGKVVVLVDVFRASTTIVCLLEKGAEKIKPAKSAKEFRDAKNWVKIGERDMHRIPEAEYSNEPSTFLEEHPAKIEKKSFLMTTTSGIQIFHKAVQADAVLVGCVRNLIATAELATLLACKNNAQIVIIAAGNDGGSKSNEEDTMVANLIADAIKQKNIDYDEIQDLESSENALKLKNFGLSKDVDACLQLNVTSIVPKMESNSLVKA